LEIIPKLIKLINQTNNEKIIEKSLKILKTFSKNDPQSRQLLIENKLMEELIILLKHSSITIKSMSCSIISNLIISNTLKSNFIENLKLLDDIVQNLKSLDVDLRLSSIWLLKNLVFKSDSSLKKSILSKLSKETIFELINDEEAPIQEQTLNFLRNILAGSVCDIDMLIEYCGSTLFFEQIKKKLDSENFDILKQCLYIFSNIAAHDDPKFKDIIMDDFIINKLLLFVQLKNNSVQKAALWVFINLLWEKEEGFSVRKKHLNNFGVIDILKKIKSFDDDVSNRIISVIERLG
jgi:hypothetical protein